jgi:hypothetical protein
LLPDPFESLGSALGEEHFTKRDPSTGQFMDVKADKKKFEGVRKETWPHLTHRRFFRSMSLEASIPQRMA